MKLNFNTLFFGGFAVIFALVLGVVIYIISMTDYTKFIFDDILLVSLSIIIILGFLFYYTATHQEKDQQV